MALKKEQPPPYYRGNDFMAGRLDIITNERDLGELEEDTADDYFTTVDEKTDLMKMKLDGFIRNRQVSSSWNINTWPFDPVSRVGGAQWLRVVTQPSILIDGGRALGRRVCELHLNDCLRGNLDKFAPLLAKMTQLQILYLHDNPNLIGNLEKIKFSKFADLEQLALQRTGIETKRGLSMLISSRKLKYIDVTGCSKVFGKVPQVLLTKPGLCLKLSRSGIENEDMIGNDARSQSRWGKRNLAKVPGAPSPFD
eukprot:CAMPEP_0114342518 /NCGR_PEP_ID=MMETSP0101-20121206/9860_1 /TAXON_ID=38822 ORGANISM="Pteridomonas danica, Strain PT" /NCGR_SAMPLE_ID=MMETSP0101 /ASSEMBLY_ACC=CAM_ASM_000211 /LENGTH=252 /DNA_ID=CAMNT_0001476667 /DNA_START=17 /DNA_END=775 /DNA_ORIENTATION=+